MSVKDSKRKILRGNEIKEKGFVIGKIARIRNMWEKSANSRENRGMDNDCNLQAEEIKKKLG